MPNRADRRAQARNARRGIPEQYDETNGRERAGLLDESNIQTRAEHLKSRKSSSWKPTSNVQRGEEDDIDLASSNGLDEGLSPKERRKQEKIRQRAMRMAEQERKAQEEAQRRDERLNNSAHSGRWWGFIISAILLVISLIACGVLIYLKQAQWSYLTAAGVAAVALTVILVLSVTQRMRDNDENLLLQRDRESIQLAQRRARRAQESAHDLHWWLSVLNWMIIIGSAIAFMTIMWFTVSIWVVAGIAVVFAIGVIDIFFLARPSSENPNVDEYGTAI